MTWYQITGVVLGSMLVYIIMLTITYRLTWYLWGPPKTTNSQDGRGAIAAFWPIFFTPLVGLLVANKFTKPVEEIIPKARIHK